MSDEDAAVVRTDVHGHEAALRPLLRDYFIRADERALERFHDRLDGLDVDEAVESDIDRLATADVDEPLFLARVDGEVVGCVQLKRLGESTAEVKRLYVDPDHRGEGLGQRLMETLVEEAATDGFTTLRLGVGPFLEPARALYEDLGFEYTPPYEQSQAPEAIRDDWCFMKRPLEDR